MTRNSDVFEEWSVVTYTSRKVTVPTNVGAVVNETSEDDEQPRSRFGETIVIAVTTMPIFTGVQTKLGVENLADAVTYLVVAVAFTGAAICVAIYLGTVSNRES